MQNVTIQQFMSDLSRDPVVSQGEMALTPHTLIHTVHPERKQVAEMLERAAGAYQVPISKGHIGDLLRSRLNVQDIYEEFYRQTIVKKMRRHNVYWSWLAYAMAAVAFYMMVQGQPLVTIIIGNVAAGILAYIRSGKS